MSVNFRAILDHRLSWEDLCRLPAILESGWTSPASLNDFLARFPKAGKDWRWQLSPTFSSAAEELFDQGYVSLEGPSCFAAWVFRHTIEVTSCARWWSFLFEPDVRTGLLDGVRGMAGILRSSTIVYLPDSAYPPSVASDLLYEGGGVAEVVDWLRTNVGEAASSIDVLCGAGEDLWNESGYAVERIDILP